MTLEWLKAFTFNESFIKLHIYNLKVSSNEKGLNESEMNSNENQSPFVGIGWLENRVQIYGLR